MSIHAGHLADHSELGYGMKFVGRVDDLDWYECNQCGVKLSDPGEYPIDNMYCDCVFTQDCDGDTGEALGPSYCVICGADEDPILLDALAHATTYARMA